MPKNKRVDTASYHGATAPVDLPPEDAMPKSTPPLPTAIADLPNASLIDDFTTDRVWGPVLQDIATRHGADVALYATYVLIGWPDTEAYRIVVQDSAAIPPPEFLNRARPAMAAAFARLTPHRMWMLSRARDFIDDTTTDISIRTGLLKTLLDHQMEREKLTAPVHLAVSSASVSAADAQKTALTGALNDAILRNGGLLVIPPSVPPPAPDLTHREALEAAAVTLDEEEGND